MDKKHSALWRHLCDEAHRHRSTAAGERQGTDAALSVLRKEMSRRIQRTWRSLRKQLYPSRREYTIAHTNSTSRWYLVEEHKRMRRGPEEIEEENDPVLRRSQELFLRDSLSAGTRWYVFRAQIQRRFAPDVERETIERPPSASSLCATVVF